MRLNEGGGATGNTGSTFHPQPGARDCRKGESALNTVSIALCFPTVDRGSGSGRYLGTSRPGKPYEVPGVAKALQQWHPPEELGKYMGQEYPEGGSQVKGQRS